MSADQHLSGPQFMPIHEIGRMESGDFPGFTMNQFAHAPGKARRAHDVVASYNRQDYRELTESIRERGVHDPLHIGAGENGPAVWDGHHRYLSARRAGLTHLPVVHDNGSLEAAVAGYHANRGQQ